MRLLVLGGTGFVGRAVVDDGLRRGWHVATFNRATRPASEGVEALVGDREDADAVAALARRQWDLVVDTWSGAPRVVRTSARALADAAARYAYVSTCSVHAPPPGVAYDPSRVVDADPDADGGEYPWRKRGAELAVLEAFGERALVARPGLILGPHEDVGRLPWWLLRLHRGGEVLVPGPPEMPIQAIDARDLAAFVLEAAPAGVHGPLAVVGPPGRETFGGMINACRAATGADATLTWLDPEAIAAAGLEPWSELPVWIPPASEDAWMHAIDDGAARAAGLVTRPLAETVADTWEWIVGCGLAPAVREGYPTPGLDPAREAAALAAWHARG